MVDQGAEDGGKYEGDEEEPGPVERRDGGPRPGGHFVHPAGVDAELSDKAAGPHAGGHRRTVHLQMKNAGGQRAGDGRGDDRRDPDPGVLYDIAHLQHRSADPLRDQTAPAVFAEGHDREADHLGRTARDGRAARKPGKPQGRADGGGGDGERQGDADDDRDQNPHEEGLQVGRPHDHLSEAHSRAAESRSDQRREPDADADGDKRRDQNVHLCFLGNRLAEFGGDDRDEQNRQRSAGAAEGVGGKTYGHEREEHKRRAFQGIADGDRHGRTAHGGGEPAHGIILAENLGHGRGQKADVKLLAQGVQDGADEQGAEKPLGHRSQRVDPVALRGYLNILSF